MNRKEREAHEAARKKEEYMQRHLGKWVIVNANVYIYIYLYIYRYTYLSYIIIVTALPHNHYH